MSDTVTDPVSGDLTVENVRDILKEAVGEERAAMRDEVIALVKEEREKGRDPEAATPKPCKATPSTRWAPLVPTVRVSTCKASTVG
jgi:hypothetical protein